MRVYHGTSQANLLPGTLMRPRRGGVHCESAVTQLTEGVLERARRKMYPKSRSRLRCVFATSSGEALHLSAVGAILGSVLECTTEGGQPECSNVGWYSAISRVSCHHTSVGALLDAAMARWAASYWNRAPLDRPAIETDIRAAGLSPVLVGFLPDAWEIRCKALCVERVLPSARGTIGKFKTEAWGASGNMLTISSMDSREAREVFQGMGEISVADGRCEITIRNGRDSVATLLDRIGVSPGLPPDIGAAQANKISDESGASTVECEVGDAAFSMR